MTVFSLDILSSSERLQGSRLVPFSACQWRAITETSGRERVRSLCQELETGLIELSWPVVDVHGRLLGETK